MTTATAIYTPRAGSIAFRVIEFLQRNEGEELTRSDIGAKFDTPQASVDTLVGDAMRSGYLVKGRNEDHEVVWRMGSRRLVLGDDVLGRLDESIKLPTTLRERQKRVAAVPLIDVSDLERVEVRKGVRLMTAKEQREAGFAKFFGTFEVGDSAEFDEDWTAEMRMQARAFEKASGAKFFFAATTVGKMGVERRA